MTDRIPEPPMSEDLQARLEHAFIAEYLQSRGYRLDELTKLTPDQAKALLVEACRYASVRLAEVEARAHLVEDMDESRRHRYGRQR